MYVNFQNTVDQFIEKSIDHLPSILDCQDSFGKLVQNNLINAMYYVAEDNYVRIQKTTKKYDKFFGADLKMHLDTLNKETNNMSAFIDITLDIEMLRHCIPFNKGKVLCTLSNGLNVHIGYKTMHSCFFYYKKPLIALVLASNGHMKFIPTFTEEDATKVIDIVKKSIMFLTFKRISSIELTNEVKYASLMINTTMNEVACTVIDERG